jgi:hypothetical protein
MKEAGFSEPGSPLGAPVGGGPHSPKKRTVNVKVNKDGSPSDGGIKACPDFNNFSSSLAHKDHGIDKESTTQEEGSDAGSYADGFDDEEIIVVESDEESETEYHDGEESSTADDESVEEKPKAFKGTSFEDESFPAPPKEDQKEPRRQVSRSISFDSQEGRVVLCTADRHRANRRNVKVPQDAPTSPNPKSSPSSPRSSPGASPKGEPVHLVPKPLPATVADDDDQKKLIHWEKPEWTKKPSLKPTKKETGSKQIEWEKPDWAKRNAKEES